MIHSKLQEPTFNIVCFGKFWSQLQPSECKAWIFVGSDFSGFKISFICDSVQMDDTPSSGILAYVIARMS